MLLENKSTGFKLPLNAVNFFKPQNRINLFMLKLINYLNPIAKLKEFLISG